VLSRSSSTQTTILNNHVISGNHQSPPLSQMTVEHRQKNYEALNERARVSTELSQVRQERDELRQSLNTDITRSTSIETKREKNISLTATLNSLQAKTAILKTDFQQEIEHHASNPDAHSNLIRSCFF
jgi:predicted RNase H-like nuclease (RuvC/YqgF family)